MAHYDDDECQWPTCKKDAGRAEAYCTEHRKHADTVKKIEEARETLKKVRNLKQEHESKIETLKAAEALIFTTIANWHKAIGYPA